MEKKLFHLSVIIVLLGIALYQPIYAQKTTNTDDSKQTSDGDADITFHHLKEKIGDDSYFVSQGNFRYYFSAKEFSIVVFNEDKGYWDRATFQFDNANIGVKMKGAQKQSATAAKWGELWYEHVYPNVDLRFYADENGHPMFDFILQKGADIQKLVLNCKGSDEWKSNSKGQSQLRLNNTVLPQPTASQRIANTDNTSIPFQYKQLDNGRIGLRTSANYDKQKPLVLTGRLSE